MTDYISRAELDAAFCKASAPAFDNHGKATFIVDYVKVLETIPAADVREVVRGKWRPYSPLTDTFECDKCGYQVIDESFRTNFCPNCGADMRPRDLPLRSARQGVC